MTYAVCPFCRARWPTLRYDMETRELTNLLHTSDEGNPYNAECG